MARRKRSKKVRNKNIISADPGTMWKLRTESACATTDKTNWIYVQENLVVRTKLPRLDLSNNVFYDIANHDVLFLKLETITLPSFAVEIKVMFSPDYGENLVIGYLHYPAWADQMLEPVLPF